MKKTLILILLFLYSLSVYSQNYYYNKGEKILVKKSNHKNYYLFSNNIKNQSLEIQSTRVFKKELNWALGRFESNELIEYVSPAIINSNGDTLNFSSLFYVKLKDGKDLGILDKMAKENNLEILGNNEFMPLWYTLSCSKNSKGNALEMANLFYESKLFVFAEVDFLIKYELNCTNDPYFNDQWGLKNTGQYGGTPGIDINYCNSRNITTGNPNIIVAVIDQGIQRGHPDITNIHSSSYDAQTGTVPSKLYYDTALYLAYHMQHGTACAGIIGANSNNNKGIAGIAPNCKLMDISHSFRVGPNETYLLANGINWAWQHGASVISNSWGGGNALHSQLIDEAISNALTQGRNGKGCVVVFSSGNENSNVSYPANSNTDIIAVGAVSPCGERKIPGGGGSSMYIPSCDGELSWGSNYGNELDILAPGVLIPTTDVTGNYGYNPEYQTHILCDGGKIASDYTNQDYTVWFNGTSASCPHVAGVAALILSVNPNLTQRQVADIIEQTAKKVRPDLYSYSIKSGRPNGIWNNEMGYGLVDAYESVRRASCWKNIYNQTISTNTQVNGCVIDVKNTIIPAGVTLELKATERIILNNGVTVKSGATLEIDGATVTIDPEFTVEEGAAFVIK